MKRHTIALLGVALVMAGGLILVSVPQKYAATAVMAIRSADLNEEKDAEMKEWSKSPGYGGGFFQTENENVRAKVVLYPVIDALDLTNRWRSAFKKMPTRQEVYSSLIKTMEVSQSQQSDRLIMSIRVVASQYDESVQVANKVAAEYKAMRDKQAKRYLSKDEIIQIVDWAKPSKYPMFPYKMIGCFLIGASLAVSLKILRNLKFTNAS